VEVHRGQRGTGVQRVRGQPGARAAPGGVRPDRHQHAAEDLLQTALAKAFARWRRIDVDAEPYVRRILYPDHVSAWRRRRTGAVIRELPDRTAHWIDNDRMLILNLGLGPVRPVDSQPTDGAILLVERANGRAPQKISLPAERCTGYF
jgi:hypothetical protein